MEVTLSGERMKVVVEIDGDDWTDTLDEDGGLRASDFMGPLTTLIQYIDNIGPLCPGDSVAVRVERVDW